MRARLTLILTIAAVGSALVPAPPAGAARRTPTSSRDRVSATTLGVEHQVQLVARLRPAERARLRAVAEALTSPPPAGVATGAAPATAPAPFIWPATAPITSPFGRRWGRAHTGVDIDAPSGAPIVAAQAGTVTLAGWKKGYGNTVVIDHGAGVSTLYAHQSRLVARTGQHLEQGQLLGYVGATGDVTAAHLHYEVQVNGVPRNPMPWLQ